MRRLKLATMCVTDSISVIRPLTGIRTLGFRESLSAREVLGIVMAVVSLLLLIRPT